MTKRKVSWTVRAEADLMRVVAFIASDSPIDAERILERLLGRAASLANMAERGRKVPELRGTSVRQQRELVVPPWRLVYAIDGDEVYVTALFDGRRDLVRLLRDRFARGTQQV